MGRMSFEEMLSGDLGAEGDGMDMKVLEKCMGRLLEENEMLRDERGRLKVELSRLEEENCVLREKLEREQESPQRERAGRKRR